MNPFGFECTDPENPSNKEIFAGLMSLFKIAKIKIEAPSSLEETVDNVQETMENVSISSPLSIVSCDVITTQQAVLVNQLDFEKQAHFDDRKTDIAINQPSSTSVLQRKSSQIKTMSLTRKPRTKQNIGSKNVLLTRFCQNIALGDNTRPLFKSNFNENVDVEAWDGLSSRPDIWKPGKLSDKLLYVF
jgi:hypothetical protein